MSDTDPTPFRRFPYGPALLCAACLAMCGYTWMRFSYAWDVVPEDFWAAGTVGAFDLQHHGWGANPGIAGRYVRLNGRFERLSMPGVSLDAVIGQQGAERLAFVGFAPGAHRPAVDTRVELYGRATTDPFRGDGLLILDTTSSRLHGASVAGLVTAAMGVFVFGLYLRSWLKERRVGE